MSKATVKFGDKDYSLVPERLKQFREDSPRSDIKSTPHWHDDGSLDFESDIIKDKSDESSMSANGWAHYSAKEMEKQKSFEKLETISVGRALAKLGYLNDGQIATTEEMQEFLEYQDEKKDTAKMLAIESLESSSTYGELKQTFIGLGEFMKDPDVVAAKDAMKEKLSENT